MSETSAVGWARFSSIRGQDSVVESLVREVTQDRVHHAHLFSGPDGVGKALAARAWASRLLCQQPVGADACGRCASCQKLAVGHHPDVMWVAPDGRFIKIDQIRAVTEATRYRPNEGRWRVIVLERVEQLNEAAANALLKTLEEPTGNTLFVLLSASPQRVLATIRSRCLPMRFAPLSVETCSSILADAGVATEGLLALSRLAGGSPGVAMQLASSRAIEEREEVVRQMLALAGGDLVTGLRWATSLSLVNERELLEERLRVWVGMVRDAIVLSSTQDAALVNHQDILPELERLVRALPLNALYSWMDALERALVRLATNVQPRLLIESLMIDFSTSA